MMPMEQWDLLYSPIYLACSKHLLGIYSLRLRWQRTTKQQSYFTCGKSAFVVAVIKLFQGCVCHFQRSRNKDLFLNL